MKKKILGAILLGTSSLSLTGCENVEATIFNSKKTSEISKLNMNKEILIDHYDSGKYGITFKKIARTSKRNQFASNEINDVITIKYEFENYSVDENLLIYEGLDFKVFDSNKNELSSYPLTQSLQYANPVYIGKSSSATIAVGSKDILDTVYIVVYSQEQPVGYIQHKLSN